MIINKENIKKAIQIEVRYVKPWDDKIRCFDLKMGYGHHIDLTQEEYKIFQKVSAPPSKEEMSRRLDELKVGEME